MVVPLGASARTVPPADAAPGEPVALYRAVYDTRFAASRAFGEQMTARGIATAATAGDITALWFDSLHARWQQGAAAIAGLTARGPLFCLERLAWDHGMRVVFRAEHSVSSAGVIRHDVEGAGALVDAVRREAMESDWVSVVSDVILRYPHSGSPNARVWVQPAQGAAPLPEDEALYSWVIAPAGRG
jgi:hypothetical protein